MSQNKVMSSLAQTNRTLVYLVNTKHLHSIYTTSVQLCINVIQMFCVYWVTFHHCPRMYAEHHNIQMGFCGEIDNKTHLCRGSR